MKRSTTVFCTFAVFLSGLTWLATTQADPPDELQLPPLKTIELPKGPNEDAIRDRIKQSLESGGSVETGIPGLDEILRGRESILNDSELAEMPDESPKEPVSKRARVAESLLKTSRLLENLGESDNTHKDLVKRMRQEAVRLLSQ